MFISQLPIHPTEPARHMTPLQVMMWFVVEKKVTSFLATMGMIGSPATVAMMKYLAEQVMIQSTAEKATTPFQVAAAMTRSTVVPERTGSTAEKVTTISMPMVPTKLMVEKG